MRFKRLKAEEFFDNHYLSIWVFLVGVAVITLIMMGGGMAVTLLAILIDQSSEHLTTDTFLALNFSFAGVMTLLLVIPNMMIVRGKPKAAEINLINIYFQFLVYALGLFLLEDEHKLFFVSFVLFPIIGLWLMASTKYHTFVTYFSAIKKEPDSFREYFLKNSQ